MSKDSDSLPAGQHSRRRFIAGLGGAAALGWLDAIVPAVARPMIATAADTRTAFDLHIDAARMPIAGGTGNVVAVDNQVPAPLLQWQEGTDVVLNVHNHLAESSSIHWHGIILPADMDGVPGLSFAGIPAGGMYQYRIPVRQSGTYWYHSHSGLQEQSGHYGPLVVHPQGPDPVRSDRDYVVVLSDWTFEDPWDVMRKLKKVSHYYNFDQATLGDIFNPPEGLSRRDAWRMKLAWDRMRMMASDIADVTGETYTYLMNGLHPAANWTGLFDLGERVRLRFINASAMSYFNVRVPGCELEVVAADGQNVRPVLVDEFQFGPAETYDTVVTPSEDHAYTIMAESIDRSGFAAGTLAPRSGMRGEIPPLRKPPKLTMIDMGMDHGAHGGHDGHGGGDEHAGHSMDHSGHGAHGATDAVADEHAGHAMHGGRHANGGEHAGHAMHNGRQAKSGEHAGHAMHNSKAATSANEHAGHSMHHGSHAHHGTTDTVAQPGSGGSREPGPVVARHGPDHHGAGNAGVAELQRNRLGERGTGLTDVPHRVLVYTDLQRLDDDFDERPPSRELELHLTGHMERYMWSFDGVQFHEVDGPIHFHHGERLRLTLVNDTMMNHPIHLHGMWLEIENGQGKRLPRKHTINVMPASRVSMLINADAPGRWAFHCHLLYHMEMGMFRVVEVS